MKDFSYLFLLITFIEIIFGYWFVIFLHQVVAFLNVYLFATREAGTFGAYYDDFKGEIFNEWAIEFIDINDFEVPKGEGVSGLIRKNMIIFLFYAESKFKELF